MPIIQITTAVGSATVVFRGVAEEKAKLIEHQFDVAFNKNEYWLYPTIDFKEDVEQLIDSFEDELRNRIKSRELVHTNLNFQFLFYEDISRLTAERLDALLTFHRGICRRLAFHGRTIRSSLFVLKDNQNNRVCQSNFRAAVEKVSQPENQIELFLVDTVPLGNLYGPIRATIRYANVLSRGNNPLLSEVVSAGNDHSVSVLTMSQYDIQENDALMDQQHSLERLLDTALDDAELYQIIQEEFKAFAGKTREELCSLAGLFGSQMPIPQKAFKGGARKKNKELDAFKPTIKLNYENSIYPTFEKKMQEHIAEFCKELVNNARIPFASKERIEGLFEQLKPENDHASAPEPGTLICQGDPRIAVITALKNMAMNDLRLEARLYRMICEQLGTYVNVDALQLQKKEYIAQLDSVRNQVQAMGGANGPTDYVLHASEITNSLRVFGWLGFTNTAEWLLISNVIARNWNQTYANYHNGNAFDCGTLDIQEFEMLRIDGYSDANDVLENFIVNAFV